MKQVPKIQFLLLFCSLTVLVSSETIYFPSNGSSEGAIIDLNTLYRNGVETFQLNPSTAGNLTQPWNPFEALTLQSKGEVIGFSIGGTEKNGNPASSRAFLLDSSLALWISAGNQFSNSLSTIQVPSFDVQTSIAEMHQNFSCFSVNTIGNMASVGCQYKQKGQWYSLVYIFDGDGEVAGNSTEPLLVSYSDDENAPSNFYRHSADTPIMSSYLFGVIDNKYVEIWNVQDSSLPRIATVIDETLIPSFSPVGLQIYLNFVVVLSQNKTGFYSAAVLEMKVNGEVDVLANVPLDVTGKLSEEFLVSRGFAYFLSESEIVELDIGRREVTRRIETFVVDPNPNQLHIVGSENFKTAVYWNSTLSRVDLVVYTGNLESVYTVELINEVNSDFSWDYDQANDVLYFAFETQFLMVQIGKPTLSISSQKSSNFTLSAVQISGETLSSNFTVALVDPSASIGLSIENNTFFNASGFSGGVFSIDLSYSLVTYGNDYQITAGPLHGFSYTKNNSVAYPITTVKTAETISFPTFNAGFEFFSGQTLLKNAPNSQKIDTDFILITGGRNAEDSSFKTVIFGCDEGGEIASLICVAKYSLSHSESFTTNMRILESGFMVEDNSGVYSFYNFFEDAPYLTIDPENIPSTSPCELYDETYLYCISYDSLEVYSVASDSPSSSPLLKISTDPYGNQMSPTSILSMDRRLCIVTEQATFIYSLEDPLNPAALSVVEVYDENDETSRVCLLVSESHVVIGAEIYSDKDNLSALQSFRRSGRSYIPDISLEWGNIYFDKSLVAPESLTVYFMEDRKLFAFTVGEGMTSANTPRTIADGVNLGSASVVSLEGKDLIFFQLPATQPMAVYHRPTISVYPQVESSSPSSYFMPLQVTFTNGNQTQKIGYNLTIQNTGLNFTVTNDLLKSQHFNVTDNGTYDLGQSGLFGNTSVLFYYIDTDDWDDIGTRINCTNAVEGDSNFSLIASTSSDENIHDISTGASETLSIVQMRKVFYLVDLATNEIDRSVFIVIPGVNTNEQSFHCEKGAYSQQISVSICYYEGQAWAVFYSFTSGSSVLLSAVELFEFEEVSDVSLSGNLLVLESQGEAHVYTLQQNSDYQLVIERKAQYWNAGPLFSTEINSDDDSVTYYFISSQGNVTEFTFFFENNTFQETTSSTTILQYLEVQYPKAFENTSGLRIESHTCSVLSSDSAPRCVLSSSLGFIDVEMKSVSPPVFRLFGGYRAFSNYQTIGEGVLTNAHFVQLVQRPKPEVSEGMVPFGSYNIIVYNSSQAEINDTNYATQDFSKVLGGVPGTSFVAGSRVYRPSLAAVPVDGLAADGVDGFLVTSNQFQKILKYNITGKTIISFNDTANINSTTWSIVAYNGYEISTAKMDLFEESHKDLIIILILIWVLVVVLIIFGVGLFARYYMTHKEVFEGKSENSTQFLTSRLTS